MMVHLKADIHTTKTGKNTLLPSPLFPSPPKLTSHRTCHGIAAEATVLKSSGSWYIHSVHFNQAFLSHLGAHQIMCFTLSCLLQRSRLHIFPSSSPRCGSHFTKNGLCAFNLHAKKKCFQACTVFRFTSP